MGRAFGTRRCTRCATLFPLPPLSISTRVSVRGEIDEFFPFPRPSSTLRFDSTLHQAWSIVISHLMPSLASLRTHLSSFLALSSASEIVLFERTTFLVISSVTAGVDGQGEEGAVLDAEWDERRFERISTMVKAFKLGCSCVFSTPLRAAPPTSNETLTAFFSLVDFDCTAKSAHPSTLSPSPPRTTPPCSTRSRRRPTSSSSQRETFVRPFASSSPPQRPSSTVFQEKGR